MLVPGVGELAGGAMLLISGPDLRHPRLKIGPVQLLARLSDHAEHQVFHLLPLSVRDQGALMAPSH